MTKKEIMAKLESIADDTEIALYVPESSSCGRCLSGGASLVPLNRGEDGYFIYPSIKGEEEINYSFTKVEDL